MLHFFNVTYILRSLPFTHLYISKELVLTIGHTTLDFLALKANVYEFQKLREIKFRAFESYPLFFLLLFT